MLAPPLPQGQAQPAIRLVPDAARTDGPFAASLARSAGLRLLEWQCLALDDALGVRADGMQAAREVGLIVARQNGKGGVLEAAELFWLFLDPSVRRIVHTAHEFKTAYKHFVRIRRLIQQTPKLHAQVRNYYSSTSRTAIVLHDGTELEFIARSGSSGRGMSGDRIVFDEAYALTSAELEALMPLLSTIPDYQLWYTSSVGEDEEPTEVLADLHDQAVGRLEHDGKLCVLEWAVNDWAAIEAGTVELDPYDWTVIAQTNPGLGILIGHEYVQTERNRMKAHSRGWQRERLSIWPIDRQAGLSAIDPAAWSAAFDKTSSMSGSPAFAIEVSDDRAWSVIASAGDRPDGLLHVEIVENRPGTSWVVADAAAKVRKNGGSVAVRPGSPAGSLIADLEKAGVTVVTVSEQQHAQASGALFDKVAESGVRHIGQAELDVAVLGSRKKPVGGGFIFAPRSEDLDISPLRAAAIAAHASRPAAPAESVYERRGLVVLG